MCDIYLNLVVHHHGFPTITPAFEPKAILRCHESLQITLPIQICAVDPDNKMIRVVTKIRITEHFAKQYVTIICEIMHSPIRYGY